MSVEGDGKERGQKRRRMDEAEEEEEADLALTRKEHR